MHNRIQYSVAVANAKLNAIETAIGASAVLKLRTGSPPASVADADSGIVIATMNLPSDWMDAAALGSKAKLGTWQDLSADASGTPGHFRIYQSDGTTPHIQGTTGTSDADLILDKTVYTIGEAITIAAFTILGGNYP